MGMTERRIYAHELAAEFIYIQTVENEFYDRHLTEEENEDLYKELRRLAHQLKKRAARLRRKYNMEAGV